MGRRTRQTGFALDLVQASDTGKVNDLGILPKPIPFGKYYLLEKINTGGMAEVFKAKAFGVEGFERILAVKRILPSIAEDEEFISMFIDEAKIAGQLNHANVAQIFDLGRVGEHFFIALEYIPGRDLRAIFDRAVKLGEKLSIAQVCYGIMKLCEGLDYAHNKRDAQGNELGIVHRDISPQNVLISYEGEIKLIDFGIAKAHGKSSSTQVGILKGKFSYMSPEQVRGGKIDRRSDIFSLGIVLYELLTLERLFLGSSDFSTLEKIRKVEFSPPTLFNPHIPQELEDIVLKALARDPADRFQTAHEMQDALQKFMFNQGLYYTNKDLASYMKSAFATEISLEQKKLEYYRTLKKEDLERANAKNGRSSDQPAADLSWDDEESSTNVFEKGRQSKEDVLAELDDIELPEDGIVYKPTNGSGGASEAESLEQFKAELPPPRQTAGMNAVQKPPSGQFDDSVEPVKAYPQAEEKKSRTGLIVFAIVLILALGAAAVYLAMRGKVEYGGVRFDVEPDVAVTVEIDGEVVAENQKPPLTIEQITANSNHEYRVIAEGYGEITGTFVVDADETRPIEVKLARESAVAGGTGFNLIVKPPNARVTVDGVPVEGTSPFSRKSLTPGKHEIVVSLDGYKTEKRTIDVLKNTIVQLDVSLTPAAVSLTLQSEPDGATYVIRDKSDGDKDIKRGKTTDIVKDLDAEHAYEIEVSHPNYETITREWRPPSNELTDSQLFRLEKKGGGSTAGSSNGSTGRRDPVVKRDPPKKDPPKTVIKKDPPKKDPPKKDPPKKDDKDKEKTAKSAPGILRINCKPPADVIINGKNYGTTPKKIDLPEGSYTVKLVNTSKGVNETKKVKVESGKIRTIVHKQ